MLILTKSSICHTLSNTRFKSLIVANRGEMNLSGLKLEGSAHHTIPAEIQNPSSEFSLKKIFTIPFYFN